MTLVSIIGFTTAMLVLAASPGPGVFATVAQALASGFRPTLVLIAGVVLGDIIFLLFATFGLSMAAQALGNLFVLIRICGSAYLIILGLKIWIQRPMNITAKDAPPKKSPWGSFTGGLLITLSNPKVILFYCGFLPTFLNLADLTPMDLGVVVSIVATVLTGVLGGYAFLAGKAKQRFLNPKSAQQINRAAGTVMIATGITIAARS